MRWRKLGLIFKPQDHRLPSGCNEYAQSPQALSSPEGIRIYFSTRARDSAGKFLSHIAFVDFESTFSKVLRVSTNAVMPLGNLGCFDEHGIFPINVVQHAGGIWAYTCGWSRRVSVPVETSIGLATSRDGGTSFERLGNGPILSSSLHEPLLVGDPFVLIRQNVWHMWYIYGLKWMPSTATEPVVRVYKIAHATSVDGIHWSRESRPIVPDELGPNECQALPTVIQIDSRFHMLFCYREASDFRKNKQRGYRLGYACSDDLVTWTRDDEKVGLGLAEREWDSEMQCYPHLFRCGNEVCLLYNGNEFGRYGFGLARLEGL